MEDNNVGECRRNVTDFSLYIYFFTQSLNMVTAQKSPFRSGELVLVNAPKRRRDTVAYCTTRDHKKKIKEMRSTDVSRKVCSITRQVRQS